MVEAGVDALQVIEVKAGMDPLRIRKNFPTLPLIGGIDVRVLSTNNRDIIRRELEAKVPILKHNGFVLHTDHSVPDTVDYETYRFFIDEGLRLGAF
jgi:uroporphyrinogen decarboxylase